MNAECRPKNGTPQGAQNQQPPGSPQGQSWSSRSLGSRFQHNVFCWLLRCRAMSLARALLAAVVFYYTLRPSVRQRCSAYVLRRFGPGGLCHRVRHTWRLYHNFGLILLERMAASVTGQLPLVQNSALRDLVAQVLQRGKGCLVVSAHVGAWQMGLGALDSAGVPVHVLQWRDPGDVDRHYFERGQGQPLHIIDATRPVEALVQVTTALRQGHMVVLMGDRRQEHSPLPKGEAAVEVEFLGGRTLLPLKPYALASITGAPLIMVFTVRSEDGIRPALGGEIPVPPGLNHRDPRLFVPSARLFAQGLEAFVAEYPYQFFNFYNLWLDEHDNSGNQDKS